MRRVGSLLLSLLALCGIHLPARAENPFLPGLIQEPLPVSITLQDGGYATLEGMVTRPAGSGPFPLVLLIHGTARDQADRPHASPLRMLSPATTFAIHGYAAVAIMRRGFGRSDGPYRETVSGACDMRDYEQAGEASADDVVAAAQALRRQPWVDPNRIVLLGQSTGGFAVMAASARNPSGVVAVIDFAGGRGSIAPDVVCSAGRLVQAARDWGRTARISALWIWSENDHYFSPTLGLQMFAAYKAGGAPAQFHLNPAYGQDGHELLERAPADLWWDPVASFLASLKLPTQTIITLPPMPALTTPAWLNNRCRRLLATYSEIRTQSKAFAVTTDGHCQWKVDRTDRDAESAALDACRTQWGSCSIYAVGQSLAQ